MRNEKSKNIIIALLGIIIVILITLIVLLANGTISFNKKTADNTQLDKNTPEKNNTILTEAEANSIGKELYDKATEIYSVWVLYPYCGYNLLADKSNLKIEKLGDSGMGNGSYYQTNFTNLEELKKYLLQYLSKEIVEEKIVAEYQRNGETYYNYVTELSLLSSNDFHYGYVDYVLKDNKLYCRLESGKGWLNDRYLGEYSLKTKTIEENKIEFTVTSTYISEETYQKIINNTTECNILNTDKCTNNDKVYKDTDFVIEKIDNNWVVTSYTLHE